MKFNYDDMFKDILKPLSLKPTYCFDLLRLATKSWKERGAAVVDAHYISDGLYTKIKDTDGQEYEITIKPTKVK
jgi:hypothetical protein